MGKLHNPKNPIDVMLAKAFAKETETLTAMETTGIVTKRLTKTVKRKKWRKITVYVLKNGKIKAKTVKVANVKPLPFELRGKPQGKCNQKGKILLPRYLRKDIRVRRMFLA